MSLHRILLPATLALLSLTPVAFASPYLYTFSGAGVSGSLYIGGDQDASITNAIDITSITGTITDPAGTFTVTGIPAGSYDPNNASTLFPVAGQPGYSYDQLLYTSGDTFDAPGIVFQVDDGSYVNIYDDPGTLVLYDQINDGTNMGLTATGTLSPAPEPSSLMLLGTGAMALAGVARRKLTRTV